MLKELISNRRFLVLFSLMFSIVCLLNVNYCILRSARNALVVADLGQGASSIPVFELCGTIRHAGFKFNRWLDLQFYQRLLETPLHPVDGSS